MTLNSFNIYYESVIFVHTCPISIVRSFVQERPTIKMQRVLMGPRDDFTLSPFSREVTHLLFSAPNKPKTLSPPGPWFRSVVKKLTLTVCKFALPLILVHLGCFYRTLSVNNKFLAYKEYRNQLLTEQGSKSITHLFLTIKKLLVKEQKFT